MSLDSEPTNTMNVGEDLGIKRAALESIAVQSGAKPSTQRSVNRIETTKAVEFSFTEDASPIDLMESAVPVAESEQLFFVRPPSGGEYGPAGKETMELWISQHRITADTLVCKLGSSQWKKAREVFAIHFLLD